MSYNSMTRQQLYELVWSKPIRDVAEELGYSDKGIAKICVRLNVPRPPQGYWNKIQAGQKLEVIPFPNEEGEREVVLSVKEKKETKQDSPPIKIHVPDKLTDPHPLIAEARKYFSLPEKERTWLLGQKILDIRVNSASVPRALRVLDSIIKELERQGAPVSIKEEGKTFTIIDSIEVKFYVEERNRLEIVEDPIRKQKEPYYRPERNFLPTGRLSLVIDDSCGFVRRLFQDGRRQTVESAAGDFISGLFEMAAARKEWRRERDEDDRRYEARRKAREIEESRVKLLQTEIEKLENISKVKLYLQALQDGVTVSPGDGEIWVNWVKGYLERLEEGALDDRYLLERAGVIYDK